MSIHRQGPTEMQQPIKSDRQTLSAFDDDAIMQQIQATHIFDGHEVDVKSILHIIEDIFHRYSPGINGDIHGTMQKDSDVTLEENAMIVGFDGIQEALASIIRKISCELSYKCSSGADAHETTMSIFNLLSNYSWDAKVVISLAAFSVNYGEFWLVAHSANTNHLIKSISLLKQVPNIIEHGGSLKSPFDALNKLINVMLEVTRSIVEFKGLPKQYISPNAPPTWTAMAHFPIAAYWVIRSMVAGASQIVSFFHMSNEDITSTTEASELISLAQKVDDIHSHLKRQERICHQLLNLKRDTDDIDIYHRYISKTDKFSILIRRRIQLLFDTVLVRLFEIAHTDNQRILKALIYAKDDILPLVEGTTKTRVGIEVLSRKTVLLLISDLDILHEEIVILGQYYQEMKLNNDLHFDIVWLPIIDKTTPWTKSHQLEFEKLLSMMPWYSVHHPSLLEPEVERYIKEVWLFTKNPILVVLNPQAEVVCTNALHMMRIWGNKAYPFTSLREESLWKEEAWRLELIVDKIDAEILEWIIQGKYICLYGGDDIEWIRKFTTTAKQVTRSAGITLEMVYVGKSNAKECVRRINRAIMKENLSHCWPHPTSIWYFWARLESMLSTKIKHGKSIQNDRIMQEILTVLSFDGSESSDQGWAIIGKGSDEITKAKGYPLLTSLTKFESWEDEAREKGFVAALEDNLLQLHTLQHYEKRRVETFQLLVRLFEMTHIDNLQILKALIYAKDDMLPLLVGTTKTRVGVEVMRRKTVLLLISGLDILHEEIVVLGQYYQEMKLRVDCPYEIVWLPIVDRTTPWTESHQLKFDKLLSMMPWYAVYHPLLLEPEVVRYIKEVWHFTKKPILVGLDPQAKVVCTNALHMMRIWGNKAYPFTSLREESLWKEEAWRLEFIVYSIDFNILEWIVQGKFICLYGGDDIAWIRKFTTTAKQVARSAGITLKMVYVGKSRPKEHVRCITEAVMNESLSYCWPDLLYIWYFWARFKSMLFSKMQHRKIVQNDRIIQEVLTVLNFDASGQGWAIISRGSLEITTAKGDTILRCLEEFENWEDEAHERGFVPALENKLKQLHAP